METPNYCPNEHCPNHTLFVNERKTRLEAIKYWVEAHGRKQFNERMLVIALVGSLIANAVILFWR